VALTLRMAAGLTVPETARAFLVQQTTMDKLITRAQARIKAARIPYRVPSAHDLPARICGVLAVLLMQAAGERICAGSVRCRRPCGAGLAHGPAGWAAANRESGAAVGDQRRGNAGLVVAAACRTVR
jgi:hypothetical protein